MAVHSQILIAAGALFMVLAGVGVLRMPDLFSRMHAATKAASLGLALILAGTAFEVPGRVSVLKLVAAIVFQFLTAPVAAHVLGRAAYRAEVPLWDHTIVDELGDRVQPRP